MKLFRLFHRTIYMKGNMHMYYRLFVVLLLAIFVKVGQVSAQIPTGNEDGTVRQIIRTEKRIQEQSQHIEQVIQVQSTKKVERLQKPKPSIQPIRTILEKFVRWFDVSIVKVEGTQLSALTITVQDKDGKQYTVKTDTKTQLRRRFWGKIESVSELTAGDRLTVIGQWTDDTKTVVLARLIRNISIQKRTGVFIGTVQSKSDSSYVIKTVNRGTLTVSDFASAKIINRVGTGMTYGDIAVGHRIRVRGLWDMTNKTLTDVTEIKDFSLPVQENKPTKATTPIPTATVAPTGVSGTTQ